MEIREIDILKAPVVFHGADGSVCLARTEEEVRAYLNRHGLDARVRRGRFRALISEEWTSEDGCARSEYYVLEFSRCGRQAVSIEQFHRLPVYLVLSVDVEGAAFHDPEEAECRLAKFLVRGGRFRLDDPGAFPRLLDVPYPEELGSMLASQLAAGTLRIGLVSLDGPDCYVLEVRPGRYEVRPGVPLVVA